MPFLEGLGYGLATVLLIGPVFFTLLRGALDHGAKGGAAVALGIIASDMVIVVICLSGSVLVKGHWSTGPWMALLAGLILLALGVRYISLPAVGLERRARAFRGTAVSLFTAGFLVNFVNPFVFAVWIAAVLHATQAHGVERIVFLTGMFVGILTTDLAKAWMAPRLRQVLTPIALKRTYLVIGLVMVGFSIRVFIHAAKAWG